MNRAVLPVQHTADDCGTTIIDPDMRIAAAGNPHYGGGLRIDQVAGMEEAVGPDVRYVMGTRRPLTIRRFWHDAVWESNIFALEDGCIQHDYKCVYKVPPNLNLIHFVESANRVLAALAFGDDQPTDRPVVDWQRSVRPRASVSRLRVLPDSA